ncbi:M1-specific T cell receptor alpha chain-like isoform X3 [Alosa pseudoharengus]|uniref:M1-specific T cell receptor alpha chain-like isoform X3 n=1 Tax=Alosa pseudoharengus TaxID=34774 RepID=UPI003F8BB432
MDTLVPIFMSCIAAVPSICHVIKLSVTTGTGNFKLIYGRGTQLIVEPKEGPDTPTYYELEKEKSKACLATDFRSHNESDNTHPFNNNTEATRIQGDKLYSKAVIMSEGDTCPYTGSNTCEAGPGGDMEPDPKLNFLTLSVLGLRILFLKTIVFNVLMTVRVWMR